MTTIKADLIQCAKGWQAEFAIGPDWICCTKVYRDQLLCIKATEAKAKDFGWEIEWHE